MFSFYNITDLSVPFHLGKNINVGVLNKAFLGFTLLVFLLPVNLISMKLLFIQNPLEEQISLQRDAQKASEEVPVLDG